MSRVVVQPGGRSVTVSWMRLTTQGLHSVDVQYDADAVRVGLNMGTRPGFWGVAGIVGMDPIVEHTVVQLREPLRRRRIEDLR